MVIKKRDLFHYVIHIYMLSLLNAKKKEKKKKGKKANKKSRLMYYLHKSLISNRNNTQKNAIYSE